MSGAEFPVVTSGLDDVPTERVDTNTWQMWAIAALPLASLPLDLIPAVNAFTSASTSTVAPIPIPIVLLNVAISVALIAIEVLLAVSDRRELIRRGVMSPMRPGWAILDVVYVIGRSVVVRRRVRGSLLPLWAWVATTVISHVLLSLPS
jgi:hypothetical protein